MAELNLASMRYVEVEDITSPGLITRILQSFSLLGQAVERIQVKPLIIDKWKTTAPRIVAHDRIPSN